MTLSLFSVLFSLFVICPFCVLIPTIFIFVVSSLYHFSFLPQFLFVIFSFSWCFYDLYLASASPVHLQISFLLLSYYLFPFCVISFMFLSTLRYFYLSSLLINELFLSYKIYLSFIFFFTLFIYCLYFS